MKKLCSVLLITALCSGAVFAQELKLSGEAKTGLLWEQRQDTGRDVEYSRVKLHSKDDAGGNEGRYRLNLDYDNGNGFGMRARINLEQFGETAPAWPYAFGYGNFFDNQLTVSVGKLGASPWGTGGPEEWKELEVSRTGGIRLEWKPAFIPAEIGRFNVGFVLNDFNSPREASITRTDVTLLELLSESVLGFSWTHDDWGLVRFAYRLDSDYDNEFRTNVKEGGNMVYRIEEHMLKGVLPGMQIWALGVLIGVGASEASAQTFRNWLFAEYSPPELGNLTTPFTAQLRFGYEFAENRGVFRAKPSFYWHFFEKLLSVGVAFEYARDHGEAIAYAGSPYYYLEVEPKIQLNFTSSYIAFAYNFRRQYKGWYAEADKIGADPIRQTQWMNLRFCIYY